MNVTQTVKGKEIFFIQQEAFLFLFKGELQTVSRCLDCVLPKKECCLSQSEFTFRLRAERHLALYTLPPQYPLH